MSRSFKDFQNAKTDRSPKRKKNLRHNGREAYNFFSEIDDEDYTPKSEENSSIFTYRSVGRGAHGESSN